MKKLTAEDEAILFAFENIVTGIAKNYGSHTEVVLHRLDADNPCIMKIANGHVTGRQIGAPITNLALSKLSLGEDISEPYFTQSPQGKRLRSTTTIIRNPQNEAIGILCINMDLDAPFQDVIQQFLPNHQATEKTDTPVETFTNSTEEMLKNTIETTHQAVMMDKKITAGKKARILVQRLFELGVFNFKNSPQLVADVTGISVHTVYRHLRAR